MGRRCPSCSVMGSLVFSWRHQELCRLVAKCGSKWVEQATVASCHNGSQRFQHSRSVVSLQQTPRQGDAQAGCPQAVEERAPWAVRGTRTCWDRCFRKEPATQQPAH